MVEITEPDDLRMWLENKPCDWAQIIAVRVALRALPSMSSTNDRWLTEYALLPISAVAMAWASRSSSTHDIVPPHATSDKTVPTAAQAAARAAHYASFAARAASSGRAAMFASDGAEEAMKAAASVAAGTIHWDAIRRDCTWLLENQSYADAARILSAQSVWSEQRPPSFDEGWRELQTKLRSIDPTYGVWIEWFDRRIGGSATMFEIKGDDAREENEKILIKFATEADENFWTKGTNSINTTVQGWLNEARARARVAPSPEEPLPEAPAQDSSATAYGVNSEGKIDRLPTSIQQHLHDVRNQRQIYADVREAFQELRAQGQRLGETLTAALDRMMRSMPDAFEDAQAYLVWRDGNRLRRLYLAHRSVALTNDPDPARLESAIAEQLGGALDLFNLFARDDDGLRAKDEATIPFQERAIAETEAALAKPVVAAMLAAPAILTDAVLGDLQASIGDDDLPSDDPYAAQTRVLTNTTWRNIIASVIDFGRAHSRTLAFAGAGAVATGFLGEAGGSIFTDLMGTTQVYAPIMNFIVANAPAIKAYAVTAYSNGAVGVIVDAIVHRYKSID